MAKELKDIIERKLSKMLTSDEEPSEGQMKLIAIGVKWEAVKHNIDEGEYGGFFGADEPGRTGSVSPKRKGKELDAPSGEEGKQGEGSLN